MNKLPSGEFFDTLGEYVYTYINPKTGKMKYVGRGVGKRGMSHVKDKGYSIDDLHIIAKNLEMFNDKPSLLLESFLISKYGLSEEDNVADNKVAGHYKECFVMKKLNFMNEEFVESQRDMFEEGNELRKFISEKFGNVQRFSSRRVGFLIESNAFNGRYIKLNVSIKDGEEEVSITIENSTSKGELREKYISVIRDQLEPENNFKTNKKGDQLSFRLNSVEEAVTVWEDFLN